MRASQTSPTIPIRPVIGMLDRVGSRVLEERLEQEVIPHLLPLRGGPVKPLPAHAREAALRALDEPGRRPSRGLPELRHAIAERLEQETGIILDPEREILITNGAMQAINIVFRALLSPDDRVLIPTPSFYLEGCTRLCGAEPIYVPGREDDDGDPVGRWRWDLDRIDASMTSATRILFACNPVNPTGYLPSRADLAALAEMAARHGAVVLADESYDRFVYDGHRLTSILTLRNSLGPAGSLSDQLVMVRSLSKSYALGTWRVGYIVAPPALIDACTLVLEWEVLHCAYVSQRVAAAVVAGPMDWLGNLPREYQRNRDMVYDAVSQSPWLTCVKPSAGPFLFLDAQRAARQSATLTEEQLLARGVPTVPGHFFQAPGYLRLPFGGDEPTIARLCGIIRDYTPDG